MQIFGSPEWINEELQNKTSLDDITPSHFNDIADRIRRATSENPVVSVIISAWNEELNIVRCIDSLSKNRSDYPFEIIVVNNNSTDRTQEVIDRLGVTNFFQRKQGVGPARELGQQKARGTYILSADADCLYPERWVQTMTDALVKGKNVLVYGRFSYLEDSHHPRWQLFLYELARDLVAEIRNVNRPHLNAYGISMGYIKEYGLREGYLNKNMRGFDGRLCFDLAKYGRVAMVRSGKARAWTCTRALQRDGSFVEAIAKRVLREFARFGDYFSRARPHNTKESENADYSIGESLKTLKNKVSFTNPVDEQSGNQ